VTVVPFSLDDRFDFDDLYDSLSERFTGDGSFLAGVISLKSKLAVDRSS
jgi:hypothetical protein